MAYVTVKGWGESLCEGKGHETGSAGMYFDQSSLRMLRPHDLMVYRIARH